ncbi:ankyrin repeat-containing protein NPR4-like [Papaver somniferum]|uniref:ankyrin repeat-containing protein NPR4-like n=1 Tax=Papaver somniferum TaxID=3469 RepID=UPI000E705646|nr:ankyrin repeat-containing protein NPR4-like [Papaver somniferum]
MRKVNGDTAQDVFTEEHKKMVATGEKWMKDTSGSCMVVATIIATVAFAAAFTVPGGNISDHESPKNGFPVFLERNTFAMFAVANAVALFSSITSVIMFLAIMTSRYTEEDFLKSLPQKLIIGLASLFLSMASILVAFGAAFTLVLRFRYPWAPIPIAIFGLISVLLFAFQDFPLFLEMVSVTYWPHVLTAKNRRPILSEKESRRSFKQSIKRTTEKEKEKEVSNKISDSEAVKK